MHARGASTVKDVITFIDEIIYLIVLADLSRSSLLYLYCVMKFGICVTTGTSVSPSVKVQVHDAGLRPCYNVATIRYFVNALFPGYESVRLWFPSASVNVMAWRLVGTKPLHKPMLTHYQFETSEQISVKFDSKYKHFFWRKRVWNCRLLRASILVQVSFC